MFATFDRWAVRWLNWRWAIDEAPDKHACRVVSALGQDSIAIAPGVIEPPGLLIEFRREPSIPVHVS